jgi:hypothetical protein
MTLSSASRHAIREGTFHILASELK